VQIKFTATTQDKEVQISVVINSWVHKNQGSRMFFADSTAYLPNETPPALVEWRQSALDEVKVCIGTVG
jgi:hypothetical protein